MLQIRTGCVLLVVLLVGCATGRTIGYRSDIQPLLKQKCFRCHTPPDGEGYLKTGLDIQSYGSLMAGTYYGEVIIPGDSRRSILNKLVEGRAGKAMRMPHDSSSLTDAEIETLRLWVEQGAEDN
jgi:Planctomycete cytochrome C